jgi:threonine dehydrogenase-like Zn-dependent dehydrogenase
MAGTMKGVILPGNRTVEFREYPIPEPGHGQVLLKMKASSLCGSDIRAVYRGHVGPEPYFNVIAGHEPCGQVVKLGPGCKRFKEGDRAVVYHILGCGTCHQCRQGYYITCTEDYPLKEAYGWQRDGGHAEYILAEERTLVALPDGLTYLDGALCACGFGTAYEALTRANLSGTDRLLVVGLGPVGLAAAMLGKAMGASEVIGADPVDDRIALAQKLGLVDIGVKPGDGALDTVLKAAGGHGVEVAVDASGNPDGRLLAVQGTGYWGRVAFVGEGNTVTLRPSLDLIHKNITVFGSWVTSIPHMEDLVDRLVRWNIHPQDIVTHTFSLEHAGEAYQVMDEGKCGKVAIVWPD